MSRRSSGPLEERAGRRGAGRRRDDPRPRPRGNGIAGLALRGALSRRGLALAVLIAAALTVAAAAIGPTYARATAESTLRDHLTTAPAADSGVRLVAVYPDTLSPDVGLGDGLNITLAAPQHLFAHAAPISTVTWRTTARAAGAEQITSAVVTKTGVCRHLVVVAGHCPAGDRQVLVSERSLLLPGARWRLGGRLSVGGVAAVIVGTYRPRDATEAYWYGDRSFDQGPDADGGVQSDDLFVGQDFFFHLSPGTTVQSTVDYLLLPHRVRLDDVPRLRADLARETRSGGLLPGDAVTRTGLSGILAAADHERRLAGVGTALVSLQLGLLGLLVLFLIAVDLAEARGPEIANAKLRGHTPRQVLTFGLAEPVLLLVAATPAGVALGGAVAVLLGAAVFVPGTPVVITGGTLLAAAAALLGGVAAVAAAAVRVLTRPVVQQWRRTVPAGRTSRAAVGAEVVAAVAAASAVVVLLGVGGDSAGTLALLAPGLLVLAVAVIGIRLLPILLARTLPVTRASPRVGLLLASRQIVRRPTGLRLATLLAVAVGLASFAVGGQGAAVGNRTARAEAEVGAATVLQVQTGTAGDPVAAVRRADPDGRWAMAAATWLSGGESTLGTVLAVDSARLPAVGFPVRGGLAAAAVHRALAGSSTPPIAVEGTRLTATITASGIAPGAAPDVQFTVRDRVGRTVDAVGPPLRNGTADYAAAVPCSGGCTLVAIIWNRPILASGDVAGTALVRALQQAGGRTTAVDARLTDPAAWRAAIPVSEARDRVVVTARGVQDRFSGLSGFGGIASAAQPRVLPVVAAPGGLVPRFQRAGDLEDGLTDVVAYRTAARSTVLPRVLADGVAADAEQLIQALPAFQAEASWQVWLAPDAPADAVHRLARTGLAVQSASTVGQRQAELGRSGPALAFLLLLVSAVAGAVLAALGTIVAIGASARRRSYEIAALLAIGVPRRRLLGAAVTEQALLLGTAALLGLPGGWLAGLLALPRIPEFGSPTPVTLSFVPALGPVLLFAAAFVLLLLVVASIAAGTLLRSSTPQRLREAEE